MYNVLICDDQPDIVNALKIYLTPEGYNLFEAFTGTQAVEIAKNNDIHLILLDVMMPVMDGWSVCKAIRAEAQTPIIMLTAKGDTDSKVMGLKTGADDYITKPFEMKEVLARIEAVLRRTSGVAAEKKARRLVFDKLIIDMDAFELTVDGKTLPAVRRNGDGVALLLQIHLQQLRNIAVILYDQNGNSHDYLPPNPISL